MESRWPQRQPDKLHGTFILLGREPVPCEDIRAWGMWMARKDRHVAETRLGDVWVSTVFLGMNYNHSGIGPPILYETMIFGGKYDQYQDRYCTWDEAEAGHKKACALVCGGEN